MGETQLVDEFEHKFKLANGVALGPKIVIRRKRNGDILRAMLQLEEDFSYDKSKKNLEEVYKKKLFSNI